MAQEMTTLPSCFQLFEKINQHLSASELRTLCFNLAIDYDDLPGSSKSDKVRELVAYCGRRERLLELAKAYEQLLRPPPTPRPVPPGRVPRTDRTIKPILIISAVLLVIVLYGTVGRTAVTQWMAVLFATPTPRVVRLTDAHVRFTVTLKSGVKLEFPASDTLTLAPGEGILIQTSVTVDQLSFPHSLTYRYFALAGRVPKELAGPNASYIAPEQPGLDVITVFIMDSQSGDEAYRSIAVLVEK